jgi:hypothetical protein
LLGLATYIGRIAEQYRFAGIGREVFGRRVGLSGAFSSEKGLSPPSASFLSWGNGLIFFITVKIFHPM